MAMSNMFALLGDGEDDFSPPAAAAAADTTKPKAQDKPKAPEKSVIKSEGKDNKGPKGGKGQDGGKGGKGRAGGYDRPPRDDEDGDSSYSRNKGGKGAGKGGKGGGKGYRGGDEGEGRPRKREFDRRSGSGKGGDQVKREGAGKANWGSEKDEISAATDGDAPAAEDGAEKEVELDPEAEAAAAEAAAEREREEKEMTLEEYQKVLEEKRASLKTFNKENSADRQVNPSEFAKLKLVEKAEETDYFAGDGPAKARKGKKKTAGGDEEEDADKVVPNFSFARKDDGYSPRENGKGKGGKGRDRPRRENAPKGGGQKGEGRPGYTGGGKGGRGYTAPNIADSSAFPTLG